MICPLFGVGEKRGVCLTYNVMWLIECLGDVEKNNEEK